MAATEAKIAAKPTKNTGITTEIAQELYDRLGRTRVAIVEISSAAHTVDVDGKKSVQLKIGFIETPQDDEIDNHLRELAQALYRERTPQKALEAVSQQEPKAADLAKKGAGLFLVDPALPPNPSDEDLIKHAVELVVSTQFGSKLMLQRKLNIQPAKAQKILDHLEAGGVLGPHHGAKARDVLVTPAQLDTVLESISTEL